MPKKQKNCDWIIATHGGVMKCRRCGDSYTPTLPILVSLYCAMSDAFVKAHEFCLEREMVSG